MCEIILVADCVWVCVCMKKVTNDAVSVKCGKAVSENGCLFVYV